MVLQSFSKINLSLNVNKKLDIGLHDIQSYFCLIDLIDKINIKKVKGKKDIIQFNGKFGNYINKKRNSISTTLSILREQNIINSYYSVVVDKKIPVFAGLGGGTGNAYSLIKHFTRNRISIKLLKIFEKKIGSDLKLFLCKQGFLKSLQKVKNFDKKFNFHFLLVYPNIKCSTKYIYSKIKSYKIKSKCEFGKINSKKKFTKFLVDQNNDLQLIAENKYPIIKELIEEIRYKKGCYFSRMSGSGSVCYGLFKNERLARAASSKIKSKYSDFWISVAKTI